VEPAYCLGLDLGQRQDHTAIAIVERTAPGGSLRLRHLERLSLGTGYPEIGERVRKMASAPALAGRSTVVADATGAGAPVIDWLRRDAIGFGIVPVLITAGKRESYDRGFFRVPKRKLIVGLQTMLEQRKLLFSSRLSATPALLDELGRMRVKLTSAGNEKFGVWGEGAHDDLVLALSLACWWWAKARGTRVPL
jgi:hypothetical protein